MPAVTSFDVLAYRRLMFACQTYLARPNFLPSVLWTCNGLEKVLYDKEPPTTDEPYPSVLIMVGKVSPDKLDMGPDGTFNVSWDNMKNAKWQLTLGRPTEPDLGADFDAALAVLEALQLSGGKTGKPSQNLIYGEGDARTVHIGQKILAERDQVITEGTTDDAVAFMESWEASQQFKDALKPFHCSHTLVPVECYDTRNKLLTPTEQKRQLKGALVEAHFHLRHHHIRRGGNDFNSFTAALEEIIILEEGRGPLVSPYRRRKGNGPYRPEPRPELASTSIPPSSSSPGVEGTGVLKRAYGSSGTNDSLGGAQVTESSTAAGKRRKTTGD